MATVKIKFRPSTVDGGQGSIFYQVIHNRVARQQKTGYRLYGYEWNNHSSEVVLPKFNESRKRYLSEIGDKIRMDVKHFQKVIADFEHSGCDYTAGDVIAEFVSDNPENFLFPFMEGVIFWILFLLYLGYLYIMSKKGTEQEEENVKDIPVWKCLLFMVLGGVMVVMGSDFAVSGATEIARFFGLTIVAFGTSLPELVTSVTAARKGNAGIAIGNIVGSNIFNILFVIGTAALICSVPFERKFIIDTIIAVLSGVLLWGGTIKKKELRKPCGILMLLGYAAYFVYLCVI